MPQRHYPLLDGDRRVRANFRERRRVSEMNKMFDTLLNLLPPSHFKLRLSRVQILREAIEYITRLIQFLQLPEVSSLEAQVLFPHIFRDDRQSNKDSFRRPIKTDGGNVQAYISQHNLDIPSNNTPTVPQPAFVPPQTNFFGIHEQPKVFVASQPNIYIAYF